MCSRIGWLCVLLLIMQASVSARAEDLPNWTRQIRADHPRLFFNAETWPAVRKRALGAERDWYQGVKQRVDRLLEDGDRAEAGQVRELGPQAAWAAFVFLVTEDARYRELSKRCLDASLRYYEACYNEKKSVNWYSTSRVHTTLAWDWLYNHLSDAERRDYLSRLVQVIERVILAKPPIYRENISGYDTGFYGVRNCQWFIGCTGFGTGIETQRIHDWLVWGYDENHKLLAHRRRACGDDGGGASPTLGYVFGAYPWAEQNFFYTWLSSTGENIAPQWPHGATLANYVLWNWIQADPVPLEFGYGDTPHTSNRLPIGQLYTHMANIRHLFGDSQPETAALAEFVQSRIKALSYSMEWFIYPFLMQRPEASATPREPEGLPHARHFDAMGQVFMRSGTGADDTYCLFTCGGILDQHRHYDALNFVIYHRGHLALDSGTRYLEFDNGQHLANYFAQTVAHNCVLIHQPGEPPARYWGGTVESNHGGQHRQMGSVLKAFETNTDFVYVAGDATACYQRGSRAGGPQPALPEKCSLVTRQIVFLLPNHFVIFDRVNATDAAYRKEWLLHTAHEPKISGREITADHGRGRMICQTLLPRDAVLSAAGGPGKEFWAAGKNWSIVSRGLEPENQAMMGQWRVEVSPATARKDDVFLHVIQVGDPSSTTRSIAEPVDANQHPGARVQVGGQTWEVTFDTAGDLGGHIRRTGEGRTIDAPLPTTVQPQSGSGTQR